MKRRTMYEVFSLLFILSALSPRVALGQFDELLQRIPAQANVLVMLNAHDIFSSPLAVKEGWQERYAKTFEATPMRLPPRAQRFVMGAKMDIEYMKPSWEVAVMEVDHDPELAEVASKVKGTMDRLAGADVVETPFDAYVVKFAPRIFGVISPADRQHAARWIREAKEQKQATLSPYLTTQASYPDKAGTEIIMALDLEDTVAPDDIRAAMQQSPIVKQEKIDVEQLTAVLSSIQGVTLGVRVGNKTFGKLKVDFGQDAAVLAKVAKPLLLEILGEAGAMIDDLEEWTPKVEGRQVSIEGNLTTSGMRRLFSFLELDTSQVHTPDGQSPDKVAADKPASDKPATDEATMPYVSQQYFHAVGEYLKDLRNRKGAKSIGQYGLWFDRYAKKIDRLPILNVDPELVDYGQNVANGLRDAVSAVQGYGIRSAARSAQVNPEYRGSVEYSQSGPYARYGAYGGYRLYGGASGYAYVETTSVSSERRAIRAEERAQAASTSRDIMKQIDIESAKVRRKMTEKYQMEF